MESNTEMQAHRSLTNMSMKKLQKLVKASFSNKHHLTNPPIQPKHRLVSDENTPPPDPNIQPTEPYIPLFNTPKSPSKPLNSHKQLEVSRLDCHDEVQSLPDPPVKVIVRIKPADSKEKIGDRTVKKVSDTAMRVGEREFSFDSILDSNSKQEDVFRLVGVPLVKDALAGYNASILSYGQTGSGKTYTMWGPPSAMIDSHNGSSQQGIVPRIFQMMFSKIQREEEYSDGKQINYQCRCSFLEIYDGCIGDLLDTTHRNLEIKDDSKNGFYIENLTEDYVTSYDDVTQILIKGLSNRKVGATSMNSKSSRSHVVFTCIIESWCKETTSNSLSSSKTSRISLVDLAGVEKLKHDDSGRDFDRQGKIMKKSISNLGHLVSILAKGTQPEEVAYESSCLTHLLQESLGGNAKLSVICTISSDHKNYSETLSTLRFGQQIRCITNNPVVNEITEEDVNDLSDQIRQLKEELLRAKLDVCKPTMDGRGQFNRRSARESLNQLTIRLNRSLMLPSIDNNPDEEVVASEDDVDELCKQLDNLRKSCEENTREASCGDSMNFASARGSCDDTYFTNEHETNCLHETEEVNSADTLQITDSSSRSIMISPCSQSAVLEDPTLSESPKIIQRKSIANSSDLIDNQSNVSENTKLNSDLSSHSVRQSEHKQSSLRSSRIFSGPTESLAASLKRGLEIIDYHQRNSASTRSSVAFSFEHLMLKPSPAVDKAKASIQTLAEQSPSFLCASCQQKIQHGSNDVQDSLKTWFVEANEVGKSNYSTEQMYKDAGEDATQTNSRYKELENVCNQQAAKIEELNRLVEQFKHKREYCSGWKQSQEVEDKEPEIIKETCEIEVPHHELVNASLDVREKEELLKEIQELKSKLGAYTDAAASKSIENFRSSLSRSMQFQKILSARNNIVEDMEKERLRWTEMESEWISLTDELRIDLETSRQHAEKVEMELKLEKKSTEELDDALHRAVLGHARIVEHYVELQEKYNDLSEKHQRIMEGIAEVKRAAAKAGAKGHGSRFAKALAAELSALRIEKEKERERLKKENKSLRLQLRDTAEAVQTAGELLVRLREAEESASVAEANLTDVQQENDRLKKQIEKQKRKHKMEMITMKQYLAESKLPQAALQPMHYEDPDVLPTSTFTEADDQAWREEFRATYQGHY